MTQEERNSLSESMKVYMQVKDKYPDCIIFYRMGDFYELFFDDAELVSKLLDLTLTAKNCGWGDRKAPMCGFPHDAVDVYSARLIELGYKVAICEQLTEAVKGKRVERDVVKVITPGTITEGALLDEKKNNFIANIFIENDDVAIVWSDITTGEFKVHNITGTDSLNTLNDTLIRICPTELILRECDFEKIQDLSSIKYKYLPNIYKFYDWAYAKEICQQNIKKQFGESGYQALKGKDCAIRCAGAMLEYLNETQKRTLTNINKITIEQFSNYMYLDINTRRNLELTETVREKKRKGSLLWLLDQTRTSMGARLLRQFIENPLNNSADINYRLDATEELYNNLVLRDELKNALSRMSDIERLCCKISYGSINPRECLKIKYALQAVPFVKNVLSKLNSQLFKDANAKIADFNNLTDYLDNAIDEDAPTVLKDGGIIKSGFNAELDEYRSAKRNAKEWLLNLEAQEKEQTGIKNLKIGVNNVFGYYIEVSKGQIPLVPYRYQRKQTLTTGERYITPELKSLEEKIFGAEEAALKLEQALYLQVRKILQEYMYEMQLTAKYIALVDVILSFSTIATRHNYCRPKILKYSKNLEIIGGRHPIVEVINKNELFVANDTLLDENENRTMIITGPNMAGKSTYMRQVALITLMAHLGSFVPADKANICLVDKIFTRIGASDDLAFGQSTFMVEMVEVSNILQNATSNSLILLDEVGRGTATFDGLSIAWAVMEYISANIKAKTLFSTHYHEISELEGILEGVKNYRVTIKEFNNSIIFLRKVVRGSAHKSFGIEVAKLAGVPSVVIEKAKNILSSLETADINKNITSQQIQNNKALETKTSKALEVCNIIKDINIERITPFEAMQTLYELAEKLK